MIGRRTFLLTPLLFKAVMFAADAAPNILLILARGWRGRSEPNLQAFSAQGVVFARAYSCCPKPELAERALLTSRFPHGASEHNQPLLKAVTLDARMADAKLGDILSELDKRNASRDTIVCFTADSAADDVPLEKSLRIPLAIRYPRKLQPAVRDLASQVDIVPTLLALRGDEIPEGVQGIDLFGKTVREVVFAEGKFRTPEEWRMLVRGYDKVVATSKGEVTGLFNLADDPLETNNLVGDPAQKLRLASLKAQLLAEMKKLGDGMDPSGLRRR